MPNAVTSLKETNAAQSTTLVVNARETKGTSCRSAVVRFVSFSVVLVLALASVELIFRAAHVGEDNVSTLHPTLGFWHPTNKDITWRDEGFSESRFNSVGMRDVEYALEKPAGVKRIAVIGDSMTEGVQVQLEQTFVKRLEQRLNKDGIKAQVMNFGMSGMSTVQGLYLFRDLIAKYQPDLCILAYHVGDNEKNERAAAVGQPLPRPYCFKDGAGKLATDWTVVDKFGASTDPRWTNLTNALQSSRIFSVLTKADLQLSSSEPYKTIRSKVVSLFKKETSAVPRTIATGIDCKTGDIAVDESNVKRPVPAVFANAPFVYSNRKLNTQVAAMRSECALWHSTLEGSRRQFALSSAVIEQLHQLCASNNCKLLVAALPAPNNSLLFFKQTQEFPALAARYGYSYCDINPVFPSLAPMEESPLYYQIHFTPAGHQLVADTLAPLVEKLVR